MVAMRTVGWVPNGPAARPVVIAAAVVAVPLLSVGPTADVPHRTLAIATPLAIIGKPAIWYFKPVEPGQRPSENTADRRVLGADTAGTQRGPSMRTDPKADFHAIRLRDDARQLRAPGRHGASLLHSSASRVGPHERVPAEG